MNSRSLIIGLILLGLQACDSYTDSAVSESGLQTDSQGGLQLQAPAVLLSSRAINAESLAVLVALEYTLGGIDIQVEEQALATLDSNGQTIWSTALDIPANVPFTITVIWSELNANLDLVRITRVFEGFSGNQQLTITTDFSDPDSFSDEPGSPDFVGFDDDEDSFNNLSEINNGTDPRDPDNPGNDDTPLALETEPELLKFNAQNGRTGSGTFTLVNPNNSNLPFSILTDSDWLTVDPSNGVVNANSSEDIILSFTCDTQSARRDGVITIASANLNTVLPVFLNCTLAPSPLLVLSDVESTLQTLTGSDATGSFNLGNNGDAPLVYQIDTTDEWLSILTADGSLAAGDTVAVEFTASCGVDEEVRSGSIELNTNNNGDENTIETVDVVVRCTLPLISELVVSPDAIDLNAQINSNASSTVVLQNTGNNDIEFDINLSDNWLNVTPGQGSIESGDQLELIAMAACTSEGSQSGSITVNSNADNGAQTIQVSLQCSLVPVPELGDITALLSLSAQSGQSATQDISVVNSGNEDTILEYSIDTESTWISFTPVQGALATGVSDAIVVVAQCDDFVGTRQDSFSIESNGGSREITVQLECTQPVLADVTTDVSLSSLLGESASDDISFTNAGNAELDFEISTNEPWLSLSLAAGLVAPGETTSLDFDAQCGNEAETRTGSLEITSNGGNDSIDITLVCAVPRIPVLGDVSERVELAAELQNSVDGQISFINAGNADLIYEISGSEDWLSVASPSGQLAEAATASVDFTAQCGNAVETRTGRLDISSNGGNDSVVVSVVCSAQSIPVLADVSDSVELATEPGERVNGQISFTNSGNAELVYDISASEDWLNVASPSGMLAEDETASVEFTAQCGNEAETRTGRLDISSNGGNDSVVIALVCTVQRIPLLADVTQNVQLAAEPGDLASGQISFRNAGNATLNYDISGSETWLSVASPRGTLAEGETGSVEFTGRCASETETLSGTLRIMSDGGNDTVPVTLECQGPIISAITPQSFSFSAVNGASDSGILSFTNSGGAVLDFTVSADAGWLCISDSVCDDENRSVSNQILPGADTSLIITASCPIDASTLSGTIIISGNFDSVDIPVTLNCSLQSWDPTSENIKLLAEKTKTFSFTWNDRIGATYYQLLESVDGQAGYLPVSPNISQGVEEYDHTVALHLRDKASYIMRACNAVSCVESAPIPVEGNLIGAIGVLQGPSDSGFGEAIDISEDGKTLAVFHSDNPVVSIYKLQFSPAEGTLWVLQQSVDLRSFSDPQNLDSPYSISLNGDGTRLAVGMPEVRDNRCEGCAAGAVFVYDLIILDETTFVNTVNTRESGEFWSLTQRVSNPRPSSDDAFGNSLALDALGERLLVGSPGSNTIYEFSFNGQRLTEGLPWQLLMDIQPPAFNASLTNGFGEYFRLSAESNTLIASALITSSAVAAFVPPTELVFVYRDSGDGIWTLEDALTANNDESIACCNDFGFSLSVSADGEIVAVGAPTEDSNASGINGDESDESLSDSGAVYVFARNGGNWTRQAYIKASSPDSLDFFGYSVDLNKAGDLLAVGAWEEASGSLGFGGDERADIFAGVGAGYLFSRESGSWTQINYIKASRPTINLAEAIRISGDGQSLFISSSNNSELYYY